MSPEEDIQQKFLWRIADNKDCLGSKIISEQLEKSGVGFSFTKKWTEEDNHETILYSYIRITPQQVQQQLLIKQQLSSIRDELIGIAKGNQDRFDRLAISKGVLDEDMVELEKSQDIMYGIRAITGERMNKF